MNSFVTYIFNKIRLYIYVPHFYILFQQKCKNTHNLLTVANVVKGFYFNINVKSYYKKQKDNKSFNNNMVFKFPSLYNSFMSSG